ncbi:MAG: hypothetical protein AB7I30_22720, partial [Isosphaeraceae bacterium]
MRFHRTSRKNPRKAARSPRFPAIAKEGRHSDHLSPTSRETEARRVVGVDVGAAIDRASFAFRGYDVSNVGRSAELLAHPAYGPTVRRHLEDASAITSEALGRSVDLVARVAAKEDTGLVGFTEDVATIVAMELAQVSLLREFFGVEAADARQSFGYSIGEMAALIVSGVFTAVHLLPVPLACAAGCADRTENS